MDFVSVTTVETFCRPLSYMKIEDVIRPFSLATYQKRRLELMKQLSEVHSEFICLFWSGSELIRNYDTHYPFRAHSNFLYLTGFSEPECMLILSSEKAKKISSLALRPRDLSPERGSEIWEGERVGVERAKQFIGVDHAVSIHELGDFLKEKLSSHENVFWEFGEYPEWDRKLIQISKSVRNYRTGKGLIRNWSDPSQYLHLMRKRKSAEEIEVMRKSAEIAAKAHIRAMQFIKPGVREFEVAAETERVFAREGASTAYQTISAAGNNACTLHYHANQKRVKKDEILLMDAGAEFQGYASDITRSFPASGKFTPAQAEVYSWVLKAQKAAIRAVKPGVPWNKPHEEAVKVISEGLRAMKILKAPLSKIIKEKLWARYMPHGTSHWLGLDVHDCGVYSDKDSKPVRLEAGNVITIEPGLYFREDDRRVPRKYRGIGIRIEDDVAVTRKGSDILSKTCPREIEDIEALRAPRL